MVKSAEGEIKRAKASLAAVKAAVKRAGDDMFSEDMFGEKNWGVR